MGFTPTIGAELAGYRIAGELGRGGMGHVFEAMHERLGRRAALKLLDPGLAADESFRERFVQESRLVAAIDHPNIVPIYDAGEVDGVLYIAMRLVEGPDLETLVRREGPLEPGHALAVVEQAAAALDAAHARDLVHRDVKPANVLLDDPSGRAYLSDFGVAKRARTSAATREGLFVGSVDYAAPEQIEGKPVGPPADVYALGCVLFECLTGRRPYEKDSDVAVVYAHMLEPPPAVTAVVPALPAALDDVVARALAKAEGERYASCGELVAAARAALAEPAAAPRAAPAPAVPRVSPPSASRVPAPATALVGRRAELDALAALLGPDGARLVTVTGPGGAGKTRIALEAARALEDEFPDGVVFVSLAQLGDASQVAPALAEALDVDERTLLAAGGDAGNSLSRASGTLVRALERRLAGSRLLLVVDNFEHVLPAAPLVSELLAAAPGLRVLATSRSALRLQGERELPLGALGSDDAVALFAERATGFEVEDDSRPAVAELCARLDGLPLAIELAAARAKLLSPEAMLVRLEDRFALLSGGSRDVPSRHQTLRGTIDWSYELLDPPGRALLARLAVFEGGCTLEAAEAVCAGGELETGAVLDGLAVLVDGSLLRRRGERFELLETIREYARYRLIERGELDEAARRHAEHVLALAEEAEPELLGPRQPAWVRRLEAETGNVRAALAWSSDRGSLQLGLRIAGALARFWSIRDQMTEGRAWLRQALARGDAVDPAVRAKALFAAGYCALGQGDYEEAAVRFEEGLAVCRGLDDSPTAASCLAQLGWLDMARGDLDRAAERSVESLELARSLGDGPTAAVALTTLAGTAERQGEPDRAAGLYEEALALRRASGEPRTLANALLNLGRAELVRGGDARELLEEGLALAEDVGDTWGVSLARSSLARAALRSGARARAAELWSEALSSCLERGDRRTAAECLLGLAAAAEDAARAARLAGAAEALRESTGAPPSPLERSLESEHLPPAADEAARRAGRRLDFEAAVRDALGPTAE